MAKELTLVERLLPASFRGVQFLVPEEEVIRGQKVAIHEYPNSDKRFAEPLGKIPSTINLTGIIDGFIATDDDAETFKDRGSFVEARFELERVLEESGVGELVHPFYGTVQVQAGEFTVRSNQRRVGEFVFRMIFYASEDVEPNPLPATENTASFLADAARAGVDNALLDSYENTIDSNAIQGAVDTVLGALDSVNNAIDSVVNPIESALAATNTAITQFRNGVYNIVQTAQSLKNSLTNTYNNLVQLTLDPDTLADAWDELIDFGGEPDTDTDTVRRANKANNQRMIYEHTRITGLVGAFEAAAHTSFNTVDDLQDRITFLDEKYSEIFETDENGILSLDQSLRNAFLNLRANVKTALDDQTSKIWRITEVDPGKISMTLLSYRYYGTLDTVDTLVELNPEVDVAFINETIKVVAR